MNLKTATRIEIVMIYPPAPKNWSWPVRATRIEIDLQCISQRGCPCRGPQGPRGLKYDHLRGHHRVLRSWPARATAETWDVLRAALDFYARGAEVSFMTGLPCILIRIEGIIKPRAIGERNATL